MKSRGLLDLTSGPDPAGRCFAPRTAGHESTVTIPSISDISERYAPDDERPLGSFLVLMSGYGAAVGTGPAGAAVATGAAVLRWRGVRLPDRLDLADLGLAAVATHKLSRLLAKDAVTSPLRAPFTRFAGSQGDAELKEEVLGRGPRKAL